MTTEPAVLKIDPPAKGLERLLGEVIARLTPEVCGRCIAPSDPQHRLYMDRLRVCLEYHAARFGEARPVAPARVIERLEQGDLGAVKVRANLLRDVVLAQALQLIEPRAAEVFETEFMPVVRSIAPSRRREGRRCGRELRRGAAPSARGREPKIATYHGRTTLGHWLGPVVANAWRTELRRRKPTSPLIFDPDEHDGARMPSQPAADVTIELDRCHELLQPIFVAAGRLVGAEDRLLLQMLILDGVPQKDLAQASA